MTTINLCRLCGSDSGYLVNLFEGTPGCLEKIEALVPEVVILRHDCLPKSVCHRCVAKVKEFHEFRENCISTQHKLKSKLCWMSTQPVNSRENGSPMVLYLGGPLAHPYGAPAPPEVEVLTLSDDDDEVPSSDGRVPQLAKRPRQDNIDTPHPRGPPILTREVPVASGVRKTSESSVSTPKGIEQGLVGNQPIQSNFISRVSNQTKAASFPGLTPLRRVLNGPSHSRAHLAQQKFQDTSHKEHSPPSVKDFTITPVPAPNQTTLTPVRRPMPASVPIPKVDKNQQIQQNISTSEPPLLRILNVQSLPLPGPGANGNRTVTTGTRRDKKAIVRPKPRPKSKQVQSRPSGVMKPFVRSNPQPAPQQKITSTDSYVNVCAFCHQQFAKEEDVVDHCCQIVGNVKNNISSVAVNEVSKSTMLFTDDNSNDSSSSIELIIDGTM